MLRRIIKTHGKKWVPAVTAVCIFCVVLGQFIPFFQSKTQAATATWNFSEDNSQYSYDSEKLNVSSADARLNNAATANGASLNLNPRANVESDQAADFSSANKEYLTVPSNTSLQTGATDFELGGWIYLNTTSNYNFCITKTSWWDAPNQTEYGLAALYTNKYTFEVSDGNKLYSIASETITTGTWNFVRAWYDKTAKTINIQINNGTINSADFPNTPYIRDRDFKLGYTVIGGSASYLDGRMDSIYFKKSSTSANEASALYNSGVGRTYSDLTSSNGLGGFKEDLTSWWNLDEESGMRFDSAGTNNLSAAAAQLVAPPVYGSEMMANTGFETGDLSSWTNFSSAAVTTGTGEYYAGSYGVKMQGSGALSTDLLYQTLTVTAGSNYLYSFWTRGDGTNQGRYAVYDETNANFFVPVSTTGNYSTTYSLVPVSFTAPAGCTKIRVYAISPDGTDTTAYFDNFSVKKINTAAISNGGFENLDGANNFSNWTESASGSSTVSDAPSSSYTGGHSVKLNIDSSNSLAYIYRSILTAGRKYKFTAYMKAASGTPTVYLGDTAMSATTISTSYTQYSSYWAASTTNFGVYRAGATSNSIYIDDVTVESLGPISIAGVASTNSSNANFAAQLNGTNQYLQRAADSATSLNVGTGDFSIFGSFYLDKVPASSNYYTLFYKGAGSDATAGYWIYLNNSKLVARFTDGTGTRAIATGATTLTAASWYNFAIDFNRGGNMVVWLNNTSDATASISDKTGNADSNYAFQVGADGSADYFPGRIDNIGFIKRTLTDTEKSQIYNGGKSLKYSELPDSVKNDSALKGFWDLD